MSVEVRCPFCRTVLRPAREMVERGGESPCPACGTVLRIEPAPARPRSRRRSMAGAPFHVPVLVWPVLAFLLVFVLGGSVLLVAWLLKPNGRTLFGSPSVTRADFGRVRAGMSPDQVRAILGRPTEESNNAAQKAMLAAMFKDANAMQLPTMRIMVWTDQRTYTVVVCFVNEQVFAGFWQDGPPNRGGNGAWVEDFERQRHFVPGGNFLPDPIRGGQQRR